MWTMIHKATTYANSVDVNVNETPKRKKKTGTKRVVRQKMNRVWRAVERPTRDQRLTHALILGSVYLYARCHSTSGGVLALGFGKLETFNAMRS